MGHSPNCHFVLCHSSGHFALCHSSESPSQESHSIGFHSVECHSAECPFEDMHFAVCPYSNAVQHSVILLSAMARIQCNGHFAVDYVPSFYPIKPLMICGQLTN
jgi:hypothetical protein